MKTKLSPETYMLACGALPLPSKKELVGWECDKVTDKQKATLDKFDIAVATIRYKGQASRVLGMITKRIDKKLSSPRQIQILLQKGYTFSELAPMTFKEASSILDRLFKNNDEEDAED